MTGTTHKAIGIAAGVGMVLYGVSTSQPLMALGMVTAPLGAMLPDVDHCNTDLGRKNKKLFSLIRTVAMIVLLLSFIAVACSGLLGMFAVSVEWFLIMPACVMIIAVTSDGFKKHFPFLTKHRGIMHTIVVPACMFVVGAYIQSAIVASLFNGLAIGYITHLLADCLTVSGCPVCFPFSKECIVHGPIRTGTFMEYVAGFFLMVGILIITYIAANNGDVISYVYAASLFLMGCGIGFTLKKILRKANAAVKAVLVVLLMVVAAALFVSCKVEKVYIISCVLGLLLGVAKNARKGK